MFTSKGNNTKRNKRGKRTRNLRRPKRTNRRYNFRSTLYSDSTRPQRYGPGHNSRIIEAYITAADNTFVSIGNILNSSTDHSLQCTLYNYYKLINIAVVFGPNQSQVTSPPFIMQVNWNQDGDTSNIKEEDNSKVIPRYRTRKYFYKFIPPNMGYIVGEPEATPVPKISMINPSEFIRTYIPASYYPGRIIFDSTIGTFTDLCRILIKIEYRGSKVPDSNSLKALVEKMGPTQNARIPVEIDLKVGKTDQLAEAFKTLNEQEESDSEYEGDDEYIKHFNDSYKPEEDEKDPKSTPKVPSTLNIV